MLYAKGLVELIFIMFSRNDLILQKESYAYVTIFGPDKRSNKQKPREIDNFSIHKLWLTYLSTKCGINLVLVLETNFMLQIIYSHALLIVIFNSRNDLTLLVFFFSLCLLLLSLYLELLLY